jgi:hypothetical protein
MPPERCASPCRDSNGESERRDIVMKFNKHRAHTKWFIGIVLLLALMLLSTQSIFPQDQVQEYPLGDIPLDPITYQKYLKYPTEAVTLDTLLPAYDARDESIVTPAKNQGNCGSC